MVNGLLALTPLAIVNHRSTGTAGVVLLVDDEDCIRDLVRHILEETGFVVIDACNGREALTVCLAHPGPIDILLSNVEMPELCGRELAARARALRPDLRIRLMSGLGKADVFDDRVPTGTAFLQKPFTSSALAETLRFAAP
jgi:CheY-like chemotaxis protein